MFKGSMFKGIACGSSSTAVPNLAGCWVLEQ